MIFCIKFVVIIDAAQTAGVLDINVDNSNFDFVCVAGHKGLYAPMGIGVLIINIDKPLSTLIEGGTGSMSIESEQPSFLPDRFESGTINVPAICGLLKGALFVKKTGTDKIYSREIKHIKTIYENFAKNDKIEMYTKLSSDRIYAPVLSFNIKGVDCEKTAEMLSKQYDIAVRAGLHCASLAHKTIGTIDKGTVRVSPSYFTTDNDINTFINAVYKISLFS